MRPLPVALQDHLDTGATTLAHCWKLMTVAGEVLGFTDHDRDLSFGGTLYRARSGFTGSEMEQQAGFAVSNLDVAGMLEDDRMSEARLRAGDFDGAGFELWLVNWQDVSQRHLLRKGSLGEVTRGGRGFTAELRGLAHLLNIPQGRIFQAGCDAVVGDSRCGVDLDQPAYRGTGTIVSSESNRLLRVSGLSAFATGWFDGGRLTWQGGANSGRAMLVKTHRNLASAVELELWQPAGGAVAPGDSFTVTAGCDRQFATCRAKFANAVNFRGFPHMPGNDFVTSYPNRDDTDNDGQNRNG